MGRDHARISVDVWSDPDFMTLRAASQHLYFLLLAQPNTTQCGSLPYTPRRWSFMAAEMDVEAALAELVARRYVLVDETTDELLIRSFMRNDGVLGQPNVVKAAIKAADALMSGRLRHALAEDLLGHADDIADLKGWAAAEGWAKANWNPDTTPTDHPSRSPFGNPSENPSGNPSANGSADPSDSPIPLPPSPTSPTETAAEPQEPPQPALDVGVPLAKAEDQPSYAATVAVWAAANGRERPRTRDRARLYRWVLDVVDVELPDGERRNGRARQVLCDYVADLYDQPPDVDTIKVLGVLLKAHPHGVVFDALVEGVERGVGLTTPQDGDMGPLALVRYTRGVLNGRRGET